jgi:hypothetical protein
MENLTNFEYEILGDFPEGNLNDEDMIILLHKLKNLFRVDGLNKIRLGET